MREAVVVLTPDQRRDQQVERRHLGAPGQLVALLQPLGVLVEHRVDDVDERLVAVDETVPAAQQVTLQPAFDGVLAEHLHDAAVRGQFAAVRVLREILPQPDLLADFVDRLELVRLRLVRAEDAEVVHVQPHDFAQEVAEGGDVAGQGRAGFLDLDGGIAEVGHVQRPAQHPAIGDRVCAHSPAALSGPGPSTRGPAAPVRRKAPPACSCASTFPISCKWPGLVATSVIGIWCARQKPSR